MSDDDVAALRAELAMARAQLDTRARRARTVTTARTIAAAVLVAVAAFALVASVVGLWAARTALSTDRWAATVAPLPGDPRVAAAVSTYATEQVFRVLDVDQRLREVLPQPAGFVVGPVTGQVKDYVQRTVQNAVGSERFQAVWVEINRRVHQRVLAVLEGTSTVVVAHDDRISIDLLPLVNEALRQLSEQLPTLFGHDISLPDLHSGQIPDNLRSIVEEQLDVRLPANFAQFTVYDGGRLRAAQEALVQGKRTVAGLVVVTVVLLLAAFAVSPRRRRTAVQLGLWLVVAAVIVTAGLRAVRTDILSGVPDGVYRDGVSAAVTILVASLRERGEQLIWFGALLALIAYLVGPGRIPMLLRRTLRSGTRAARRYGREVAVHAPSWSARHLDALRVGGVVVAAVLALLFASWAGLIAVAVLLAAYEVGVTALARTRSFVPDEAPAADGG